MFKTIKEFFKYKKTQKIQASPVPFFDMKILKDDAEGIEVEMDWNNAFIMGLRDKGYKGIADEQVIESYLFTIFEKAHVRNMIKENMGKEPDNE
jgi:hypothetical protein